MRRCLPVIACLPLLLAACGGDAANPFSGSTTTVADGSTDGNGGDPTTTVLTSLFPVDPTSIEGTPPTQTFIGVDAVLGAGPDPTMGAALTAAGSTTGLDLTGVSISVWPITGTANSLLVIHFGPEAVVFSAPDGDPASALFNALLASPLIDDQSVTQLVIRIVGTDDEGPYTFLMTTSVAAMRNSLATGDDLPEGEVFFSLTREGA